MKTYNLIILILIVLFISILIINVSIIYIDKSKLNKNKKIALAKIHCYRKIACITCSSNKVCFKFIVDGVLYFDYKSGSRPKDLQVGDVFMLEYEKGNPLNNQIDYELKLNKLFPNDFFKVKDTVGSCNCPDR